MDGQMLSLSEELISQLSRNSPTESLSLEAGVLEMYESKGEDLLLKSDLLNIVLRANNSSVLGFHIPTIQKVPIPTEPSGTKQPPNMSPAVGLSQDKNHLNVQHWDGYLSVFDVLDLTLLKQMVTR